MWSLPLTINIYLSSIWSWTVFFCSHKYKWCLVGTCLHLYFAELHKNTLKFWHCKWDRWKYLSSGLSVDIGGTLVRPYDSTTECLLTRLTRLVSHFVNGFLYTAGHVVNGKSHTLGLMGTLNAAVTAMLWPNVTVCERTTAPQRWRDRKKKAKRVQVGEFRFVAMSL